MSIKKFTPKEIADIIDQEQTHNGYTHPSILVDVMTQLQEENAELWSEVDSYRGLLIKDALQGDRKTVTKEELSQMLNDAVKDA